LLKSCLNKKENTRIIHNIEEDTTIDDVPRDIPKIYATLEDYQADHQIVVVEVEVKFLCNLFPF
jgi:hypothetical protein